MRRGDGERTLAHMNEVHPPDAAGDRRPSPAALASPATPADEGIAAAVEDDRVLRYSVEIRRASRTVPVTSLHPNPLGAVLASAVDFAFGAALAANESLAAARMSGNTEPRIAAERMRRCATERGCAADSLRHARRFARRASAAHPLGGFSPDDLDTLAIVRLFYWSAREWGYTRIVR